MGVRFRSGFRFAARKVKVEDGEMGAGEKDGDLVGGLQRPPARDPMRQTTRSFFFDALNSSSYPITSINPSTWHLVIHPAPFASPSSVTTDLHFQGIILNNSHPFNVSSSNTIIFLNCTSCFLLCSLNTTANDAACRPLSICCTFIVVGSSASYAVRASSVGCNAYRNFVNPDVVGMPMPLGSGWEGERERERGRLGWHWRNLSGAKDRRGYCGDQRRCS